MLPPDSSDVVHPLAVFDEKATQPGAERPDTLDRERAPPRCMLHGRPKRLDVARRIGIHARLERDRTTPHLNDRERVRITVRINTNHKVQLICKHHATTSSPGWGTLRCRS